MGDPAGVGPELCLATASNSELTKVCRPVFFGDLRILERVAAKLGMNFNRDDVIDIPITGGEAIVPGEVNATTGQASFDFVDAAIGRALSGEVAAVVTAPINKEAWNLANIKYPGHTELFAERAEQDRFCMLMTSPTISCSLVTCHVGYRDVPTMLTRERVLEVIVLTYEAMKRLRGREPRLVVPGLNPHAGENGLFGSREEETIIVPAITQAREQGIEIEGPLPPDTAFVPWKRENTDAYVCMYHDQGLIPFKALAFDTGVNTTLGLPVIRTSVDHGTALDIAWEGKADPSSMFAAINLAIKLSS